MDVDVAEGDFVANAGDISSSLRNKIERVYNYPSCSVRSGGGSAVKVFLFNAKNCRDSFVDGDNGCCSSPFEGAFCCG